MSPAASLDEPIGPANAEEADEAAASGGRRLRIVPEEDPSQCAPPLHIWAALGSIAPFRGPFDLRLDNPHDVGRAGLGAIRHADRQPCSAHPSPVASLAGDNAGFAENHVGVPVRVRHAVHSSYDQPIPTLPSRFRNLQFMAVIES